MHTRAQGALSAGGEGAEAPRELFGELLRYPGPLRHVAEIIQGSDVAYPMPAGGAGPAAGLHRGFRRGRGGTGHRGRGGGTGLAGPGPRAGRPLP